MYVCVYVCMCVYVCACVCVCMYVCVCIWLSNTAPVTYSQSTYSLSTEEFKLLTAWKVQTGPELSLYVHTYRECYTNQPCCTSASGTGREEQMCK